MRGVLTDRPYESPQASTSHLDEHARNKRVHPPTQLTHLPTPTPTPIPIRTPTPAPTHLPPAHPHANPHPHLHRTRTHTPHTPTHTHTHTQTPPTYSQVRMRIRVHTLTPFRPATLITQRDPMDRPPFVCIYLSLRNIMCLSIYPRMDITVD